MIRPQWTTPYHGVTHYGQLRDTHRCSVTHYSHRLTVLHRIIHWSLRKPGDPMFLESTHGTVLGAKRAGARWVNQHTS